MSLPCSIRDLIPQKGKMGFDQILSKPKIDDSESTTIINEDNIFLDDNKQLSNIVLIEYINQLIAAVQGYNGKYNNKPMQNGLFVGLQDAEFFQPIRLGDRLNLKGYVTENVAQVTFIQGIIFRDGEKIAELVTKLYEAKDLSEFDLLTRMKAPQTDFQEEQMKIAQAQVSTQNGRSDIFISTNHGPSLEKKNNTQLNQLKPPAYLFSSMHRKLYTYFHDTIIGDDFISFYMACPDDFDAFDGHFPRNPILPGIILLEIGNLAVELFMEKAVVIKSIKKMKISGVVLPNQVISCNIKIDRFGGSKLAFSAIFKEREREISRFSGYCMPTGAFDERREL